MAKSEDNSQPSPPQTQRGVVLRRTLEGHRGAVNSLALDGKGELLISGSDDKTVKLWEFRTGKLLRTLEGHSGSVFGVAADWDGEIIASGGNDLAVNLWDARSGRLLRTLEGHRQTLRSVAFQPHGKKLASAGDDNTVKVWDAPSGKLLRTMEGHQSFVVSIGFDPAGSTLASGGLDSTVKLWDVESGDLLHTIEGGHQSVYCVTFAPGGEKLVSGGDNNALKLWETESWNLLRTIEGHTDTIEAIAFSSDGRLLASKSKDRTIRLWSCDTWETVAIIPVATAGWEPALLFHPTDPLLLSIGAFEGNGIQTIRVWELGSSLLLGKETKATGPSHAVHHTTGKIVLVGDHSVGKSALGYRLIHGRFEKQESTHGQQFWVFPALGKRRADGTECEAILWDFAGQPDYRLVHALFIDNSDLALVLFDASDLREPLRGVGFWINQLRTAQNRCAIILVAAQTDRGTSSLTADELNAFCKTHEIKGPVATSALSGVGIDDLLDLMKSLIPWEAKPPTVTTATFKRIKDYVLSLKEQTATSGTIVTSEELYRRLAAIDREWHFTVDEMLTAVGHLENYGYVKRLRTSKGELRILLEPQRLNNLASSFVLEARRNPKGLGALEEKRLLAGDYDFPELKDLDKGERDILLDAAALLFLEHNVCLRETDPLRVEPYLIFPELINLKKPPHEDFASEDGAAYTVSGPPENVFASLVVLLGYTHTFTRTAQWHNNARYEVGDGLVCGFRQEAERDGELDFVLCYGPQVGLPVRTLFQGLFESFLGRRNLTVMRYEPLRCTKSHLLNRTVVREAMQHGDKTSFCPRCGEQVVLPRMAEPIQLTREVRAEVESQRRAAEQRTRFEQAIFRVLAYLREQEVKSPDCFISYAWGVPEHERWVEKRLATDLQKAGINVLLDRWDNAQIGSSVARFVERIEECDRVVVVGTPFYRQKAKNVVSAKGSVVAAECDVAGIRLLATEDQKRTVLPVLLAGEESESFPPLMRGRVYGDFRNEDAYFATAFDLILSLYDLPLNHPAVADLRDTLREREMK